MDDPSKMSHPGMRWLILFLSCFMLFGNYYAFDNPSSLNRQLREWLSIPADQFQIQLNLLYSVYSIPNVFLPLVIGAMFDRLGRRQLVYVLSLCVVIGQVLFTFAVQIRSFPLMLVGRVVFGIGGESLGVAQTKMMTDWFRGKELSLAIGLNLSVGRVGTVANNFISPIIADKYNVPVALWVGAISCVISLVCSIWATILDSKFRTHFINIPIGCFTLTADDIPLGRPAIPTKYSATHGYHPSFWLLTIITFLLYVNCGLFEGVLVPFNNIASDFLQTKYTYLDPVSAGRLMSIPDSLCIFIVPVLGYFLDRIGYRGLLFTCGSFLMSAAHFLFSSTQLSPVLILCLLGISNSSLLAIWPCVPLMVSPFKLSTAYGILTSASNVSFMLLPLAAASFINKDPTYSMCELFFCTLTGLGFLLGLFLNAWNYLHVLGLNEAEFLHKPGEETKRRKQRDSMQIELLSSHDYNRSKSSPSIRSSDIESPKYSPLAETIDPSEELSPFGDGSVSNIHFRRSITGFEK